MTPPVLLDQLMMEILSWLPVKSLVRFMCVSKQFQSFVSDPSFVKLHLQRSPKGVNILLEYPKDTLNGSFLLSFPLRSLLESPSSLAADDLSPGFDLHNDKYGNNNEDNHFNKKCRVVGSCNGLVCLDAYELKDNNDREYTFRLWNPATRKTYEDPQCILVLPAGYLCGANGFGYDNLSDTYKVVTVSLPTGSLKSFEVRVCSIRDNNCWRKIQSFPAEPVRQMCSGIYLNSTLNWIAHEARDNDELLIVSLDLGKDTYTKLLLPRGLDGVLTGDFVFFRHQFVPNKLLSIGVLKDCLSLFFCNPRTKLFALWQMKEFGNQNSWTLLLNISSHDLQIDSTQYYYLQPLYMFENGGVLMIHKTYELKHGFEREIKRWQAILYNGRDKTVKHSEISSNILWIYSHDYVQSLVLPRRY